MIFRPKEERINIEEIDEEAWEERDTNEKRERRKRKSGNKEMREKTFRKKKRTEDIRKRENKEIMNIEQIKWVFTGSNQNAYRCSYYRTG